MPVSGDTPETLRRDMNRRFGEDTFMFASDPRLVIERLPTGILSIDVLTGGGFPRGRHVEIYGNFGVGKSYCLEHLIATTQASGGRCAYIDAEKTYDPVFAAHIGVDNDTLAYHKQREHGDRCIDFMETLLYSGLYDVIGLDSIAALLPRSEQEKMMSEGHMGTAQAKLMSLALRKLTTANERTVLVYINQTREAVGVMFGNRNITSGGKAMGFYAGTRLEMVRTENIKRSATVIDDRTGNEKKIDVVKGHRVLVRVTKDKTGGAMQQATSSFVFDYELKGVDPIEDLILLGRQRGLVGKSGNSWWVEGYEDETSPSRAKFKTFLKRNRVVREELEERIRVGEADHEQTEGDDG